MEGVQLDERAKGSLLLQLLYFAGWTVEIRKGRETTIRAARDEVHLEVTAASFAQASGVVFAKAMRSRASGGSGRWGSMNSAVSAN